MKPGQNTEEYLIFTDAGSEERIFISRVVKEMYFNVKNAMTMQTGIKKVWNTEAEKILKKQK